MFYCSVIAKKLKSVISVSGTALSATASKSIRTTKLLKYPTDILKLKQPDPVPNSGRPVLIPFRKSKPKLPSGDA